MMSILTILVFTAVLSLNPVVQAAPPTARAEDIATALPTRLKHPYLFFTAGEKPAILARIEADPDCRAIMDHLTAETNRLLYTPVTPLPPQPKDKGPQLFDLDYEFSSLYNGYRNAAYELAFMYQMTGEERYARKSFEFAREVSDMPTWVLRLCQYPKAYYRVSPWNVTDDKVVFTFAINASDTASYMAMTYDWLYPALTRDERDVIRGGLLQNAIVQVRGNYEYHWWSTAYRCNWCAWCNTGLGLAALALLTEDPQLVDVAAESYNRIWKTLDWIGVDGGWQEGASYWGQTTRMSILFGDALKRLTSGRFNIYEHPRLTTNTVNFPLYLHIPPGGSVNFQDSGSSRFLGTPRLYNKLALETGSTAAAWIRDNWYEGGTDIFDVIWPRHTVEPALPDQASIHFRSIDWVVMRSDLTSSEKTIVACKAGKNDDPHHGHLDIGQVVLNRHGMSYITDHGAAKYDEKFFDEEKYDTPQANSQGHNLIFVNGECQVPGKRFRTELDETIGGKVVLFRSGEERDYTLMDPTSAYAGSDLKGWRRHVILEKPDITVILDEVQSAPGAEIEARFHSACPQTPREGWVLLDGPEEDMALLTIFDGDVTIRTGRHAYQALFRNADFEWIPYVGTVVAARGDQTVLAHIVIPIGDTAEGDSAARMTKLVTGSDGCEVTFTAGGRKYHYSFDSTPDGLLLRE
jgi:hypothetical protein